MSVKVFVEVVTALIVMRQHRLVVVDVEERKLKK